MSKEILLTTTVEDYHALHVLADSKKQAVRIDRQKLLNLLLDHTVMVRALANCQGQYKVTEPSRRPRVRAKDN